MLINERGIAVVKPVTRLTLG